MRNFYIYIDNQLHACVVVAVVVLIVVVYVWSHILRVDYSGRLLPIVAASPAYTVLKIDYANTASMNRMPRSRLDFYPC